MARIIHITVLSSLFFVMVTNIEKPPVRLRGSAQIEKLLS